MLKQSLTVKCVYLLKTFIHPQLLNKQLLCYSNSCLFSGCGWMNVKGDYFVAKFGVCKVQHFISNINQMFVYQCTYICLLNLSHRIKRWNSHRSKQLRCVPKADLIMLIMKVRQMMPVIRLFKKFKHRWQEGRRVSSSRAALTHTHKWKMHTYIAHTHNQNTTMQTEKTETDTHI